MFITLYDSQKLINTLFLIESITWLYLDFKPKNQWIIQLINLPENSVNISEIFRYKCSSSLDWEVNEKFNSQKQESSQHGVLNNDVDHDRGC